MRARAGTIQTAVCIAFFAPLCGFTPEASHKIDSDYIVTAAPAYEPLAALKGQERFPKGAQLLFVHDGKPKLLLDGFAATADASVSFDGSKVLFAGKEAATDPWQVWELTLADHSLHQVTNGSNNAVRPLYLPGGRFVFAQRTPQGFQLRSAPVVDAGVNASAEGAQDDATTLTFANASAMPSDVLADGRILFESGFPLGSGSTPELFLVYSDGSGVESYRCDHGAARWGGKQLASGDVIFTHGSSLARFTSPLAHEERILAPRAEYAGRLAETQTGGWLLSTRMAATKHYSLMLWTPGSSTLQTVLAGNNEDLVEPVLVARRTTPKRHPSALHPWDYSNLLALDARLSREGALKSALISVQLETQDANGHAVVLGASPVEQDGSFFIKVPGDKPIRVALLDAKGTVLRQERGWFWARGGEQRYCVGCHTGPERAPENKVPAVLLRTTTPVDLTNPTHSSVTQRAAAGGH
jgi:hypothetical protein